MKDKDKVQFKRKVSNNNGTCQVNLPAELAQHLELEAGESEVKMQSEHGEHGVYISAWNPEQQSEEA
jgi:hypothetical protein